MKHEYSLLESVFIGDEQLKTGEVQLVDNFPRLKLAHAETEMVSSRQLEHWVSSHKTA